MDLRQMTITGRVGKTPEMLTSKGGAPYTRVSIAVNEAKRNQDGSWDQETTWVNVALFGKTAEYAVKNFSSGVRVHATGDFSIGIWKDKPQVDLKNARVGLLLSKKENGALGYGASGGSGGGSGGSDDWD